MEDKALLKMAEDFGFEHFAILDPRTLEFRKDVRDMCNPQSCPNYDKRWSCPPAVADLPVLAEKIENYSRGLLVQTVRPREDSFDFEAMIEAAELHKQRFADMTVQLWKEFADVWPMSAGACEICKECTYPDQPCRFPDKMFSSMEALGLYVAKVCTDNSLAYNYGNEAIAYTSCFLLD